MNRLLPWSIAALAVAAFWWSAVAPASSQPAGGSASMVPRTPDGKPDFSGFWQVMNSANEDLRAHHARLDTAAGLSVIEGDEIPYQAWALEKKRENVAKGRDADPESRCFAPGVPRIMYMPHPFQIAPMPDSMAMLFEYTHQMRNIHMNSPHPEGPIEWWMGDSRGRWEGETLVVDVTHLNDETWFDRAGDFHSDALHVVERYTMIDRDHIRYEAMIEDLKVFTRPWKMNMIFYRHIEPNFQLLEYECSTFEDEAAGNLAQPKGAR